MMTLHGCGGKGIDILLGSHFDRMAASNDIIMIAPTAAKCWDDHGMTGPNYPFRYGSHPSFLMNLAEHVMKQPTQEAFL